MTQVPANWRKSSFSASGQQCVELTTTPGAAHIRDSKRPDDGYLTVEIDHLSALIEAVKAGEFDNWA